MQTCVKKMETTSENGVEDNLIATVFKKIADNAALTDVAGVFPEKEFEWIADAGLLHIVLPGYEMDFNENKHWKLFQLLQKMGAANLSVGRIYEGHVNALHLLHLYGTAQQKENIFALVISQKKILGVWNSEHGNGVKICDDGGKFYLQGSKTFCSGGSWLHFPVVTGMINTDERHGWQMCIVDMENATEAKEDKTFWTPHGMKASASFKIDFTNVEIGTSDLLGAPDDYYRQPWFSGGALRFAAVQLGAATAIVHGTHQFLKENNRTGTDHQKARIAEMMMQLISGENWINSGAEKMKLFYSNALSAEQIINYAALARTAIEAVCSRIIYLSAVCVGTMGLMQPGMLERMHRDLNFYLKQPAPDAVITGAGQYLFSLKNIADAF